MMRLLRSRSAGVSDTGIPAGRTSAKLIGMRKSGLAYIFAKSCALAGSAAISASPAPQALAASTGYPAYIPPKSMLLMASVASRAGT